MTTITIKKIAKGSRYEWLGNGMGGTYTAGKYGAFDGDNMVAILERIDDGSYMSKASWKATRWDSSKADYARGERGGYLILTYADTLGELKKRVVEKLQSVGA